MKTSDKLKGHLSIAAAYTIFGLNLVFCKDIANSQTVSPYVLFTLRAIGASVLFWLLSMLMPREKVERGDYWKIAAASLVGLFVPQMTFLMAITMTSAIDTAIIGTLGPIFTMFFAFFFLGEPITGKKAGGVALSFVGILFLIFNSVHSGGAAATSPWGVILLLVNSLSFSLYLGLFRPLISKYSVITFMKWSFLFSLLLSLPISARGLVTTDFAAIPVNVRWECLFPHSLRTKVHPAHAREHVLLRAAHHCGCREHLGGSGYALLAKGVGIGPGGGWRGAGFPEPGGRFRWK